MLGGRRLTTVAMAVGGAALAVSLVGCSSEEAAPPRPAATVTGTTLVDTNTPAGQWMLATGMQCNQLVQARDTASTASGPTASTPTAEQRQAFAKAYLPAVQAFALQVRALSPPDSSKAQATELADAADALAAELQAAIADPATAQKQLEQGADTPAATRLRDAVTALDVPACSL